MNTSVTFPIAKLLKEKGFDVVTKDYFDLSNVFTKDRQTISEIYSHNWNARYSNKECTKKEFISAPAVSKVIMWLYEEHDIWVQPKRIAKKEFICFYTGSNMCEIQVNGIYDSPTKAALAAIEHTLITLIK